MRKIQFKAWDKVNKKFITDYKRVLPTHYEGSKFPIEHGGVNHNCVYVPICDESNKGLADIGGYIDDCILLLWTCLKDKNGKEIYEGDIVHDLKFTEQYFEVKLSKGKFYLNLLKPKLRTGGMEEIDIVGEMVIIGNIYENPELIK